MKGYEELPGFEHLYLEDSFVLGIDELPNEIRFRVEAVLTKGHPQSTEPRPNEVNSYRQLTITFPGTREIWWEERSMKPIRGPDGEVDYGNIDVFRWEGEHYEVVGEWGHVHIESEPPRVIPAVAP